MSRRLGLSLSSRRVFAALRHNLTLPVASFSSVAETRPPPTSSPTTTPQILHHLSPSADDYGRNIFIDKCTLTVQAGSGGHGCVSFHRDIHISDGPPNGGDGGTGGNVYIQAVKGPTSLHKLARRSVIKAGRGGSGSGGNQGGSKGDDVLIQVPLGTVVREVWRSDPGAVPDAEDLKLAGGGTVEMETLPTQTSRDRWIFYPGTRPTEADRKSMPPPPAPRKSSLAMMEPQSPIELDLSEHMEQPMLLIAGAEGGFGNPHFMKPSPKPKIATKGELGVRLKLELELKLLADVGLVGLPNAGKSTLLRSVTNSRTRVADWAFTTLSPSIGTVILDNDEGRPAVRSELGDGKGLRTHFTIADIPGLVEDAHQDKGLGLSFLRHIERARILAFVIDLSAGDAVAALKSLWKEVEEYGKLRNRELREEFDGETTEWKTFGHRERSWKEEEGTVVVYPESRRREAPSLPSLLSKPWFVVATKADKEGTQDNFRALQSYLAKVAAGEIDHPSGAAGWGGPLAALPVSAIRAEGVDKISQWVGSILQSLNASHANEQ